MATIRWARAEQYNKANTYLGANGEVVIDMEQNRIFLYDGANAYFSNAFVEFNQYQAPSLQGSVAGYAAGGAPTSLGRNIQSFSFSSDVSAVDTGADLFFPYSYKTTYRTATASHVGVNGYTLGGYPSPYAYPSPGWTDIHKFSFTSATNSSFVGTITSGYQGASKAGTMSRTDGYIFGGQQVPTSTDNVDRVPFSSDTDSVDVGELSASLNDHLAATNGTYAWLVGGVENYLSGGTYNLYHGIKKVPFASAASDSEVGDIQYRMTRGGVAFDEDNGYVFGGRSENTPAPFTFAALPILKWPFASNTPSTEIAPLALPDELYDGGGHSSQTHGYYSGGGGRPTSPEAGNSTRIHKFPFSSNSPGLDVGELASAVSQHYGLHT